ncbi:hypothetical protein SAMN05421858_1210 [Haladaptatus litoreus]|uniref:Uncharacterized protein n=1 Tax=Haladaptatus litoreus TaxID=553468 RepID=A0A1N6XNW1_9EURY|nr:hypothetical protein SAMN05421858_1210 [Haladaptatus litoreus]
MTKENRVWNATAARDSVSRKESKSEGAKNEASRNDGDAGDSEAASDDTVANRIRDDRKSRRAVSKGNSNPNTVNRNNKPNRDDRKVGNSSRDSENHSSDSKDSNAGMASNDRDDRANSNINNGNRDDKNGTVASSVHRKLNSKAKVVSSRVSTVNRANSNTTNNGRGTTSSHTDTKNIKVSACKNTKGNNTAVVSYPSSSAISTLLFQPVRSCEQLV